MKFVFAKMGLETAATEIFGKLEKGLEPKLNLEELAPGTQASSSQPVSNGFVSFCSAPVFQDGIRLRAVLKLRKSVLDAYYSLQRRRIVPGFDTVPSLIEAAVAEYLRLCPDLLQSADTDRLMVRLGREVEEILRMAAARLMFNPVLVSGYGETHARRLFYDCNSISYLRYERAESNGRVLLTPREHPNVRPLLTRRTPLPMSDHRAVRKLLELASDDVYVLSDGYQVYGLAAIQGRYDESRQDLYSIRFVSQSNWEFYHGERLMMRVLDSRPELPDIRLESRFKFELLSLFPLLGTERLEDLWNLVQAAGASRRGAIVVIAEDASEEAARLEVGSTRVEPTPMSPELMKRVCAIDGAVLIDTSGTCHSIGVILDGLAASTGDSSRGARYNSAVRFARSTKTPCLLAVVSEDGGTDLLSSTAGQ